MHKIQFRVKHCLLVMVIVSIALSVFRWRQKALIVRLYGDGRVYRLLAEAEHFTLLIVSYHRFPRLPLEAIEADFPLRVKLEELGELKKIQAEQLQSLLTTPQNFEFDSVKDFCFTPEYAIRVLGNDGDQLDLFLCMDSEVAVPVLNGRPVGALMIDAIAQELKAILEEENGYGKGVSDERLEKTKVPGTD